jgi:hypothetical protein
LTRCGTAISIKIRYGVRKSAATRDTETPKIKAKILKDSLIFDFTTIQYVQNIIIKNEKQINCNAMQCNE